ncbi:hypothetical protein D1B31_11160 [Neobacillus notoginsengisoli]|uniref:Spore coat protein n=2 Tax=Neobacillus notoginsengisoli TaxID=1578198 RepID=A0A417YUQ0_9BACI|nr:hypothetical protein [Neobacillus notoginsengisoli]RHW40845.1 hypothetical protein D1B31_11160 [Neobacillus notoginsengisoli]
MMGHHEMIDMNDQRFGFGRPWGFGGWGFGRPWGFGGFFPGFLGGLAAGALLAPEFGYGYGYGYPFYGYPYYW